MPYTVNDCFEKFRKDVVDLEPGQTKTARGSRDFVYKNIGALFLRGETPRLIDEWQTIPILWDSVRSGVDDRSLMGQFI